MTDKLRRTLYNIYMGAFLFYLLVPLALMGGAAFNDSKLPSVYPWKGLTDRWFVDLWNDDTMWYSFRNTLLVALAVVALAVPIGTAAGNGMPVRNSVGVRNVTAEVASRYSPCSERSRTKALRNASFGTTSA